MHKNKEKNFAEEQLSISLYPTTGQNNKNTKDSQKIITLSNKRNYFDASKLDLSYKSEIIGSDWQINNKSSPILHQIDVPPQIDEQHELIKIIQKCKEDAGLKEQLAQNQFEINKDFLNKIQDKKPHQNSTNSLTRFVLLPEHLKQKKELRDILVAKALNEANPQNKYVPIRARIVKKI